MRFLGDSGESAARILYDQCRDQQLDIQLSAHCLVDGRPWCYIGSSVSGETGMIPGVSIATDLPKAQVVRSRLGFWLKRLAVPKGQRDVISDMFPMRPVGA